MVTEVITRTYCDAHNFQGERVEAEGTIHFAHEQAVREVDACQACIDEHNARIEPLLDRSRVAKKRRTAGSGG